LSERRKINREKIVAELSYLICFGVC